MKEAICGAKHGFGPSTTGFYKVDRSATVLHSTHDAAAVMRYASRVRWSAQRLHMVANTELTMHSPWRGTDGGGRSVQGSTMP